jgi:tetratricopeptide (TPR) repeat protein
VETLNIVNQWIDTARTFLAKQVHIPLIDNDEIDMTKEIWDAWEDGDGPLREAMDNVLSRDPDDLAARFVALNAYYRLMTADPPEDGELSLEELREHLGYLVRLRDVNSCVDVCTIRWEIVNACAVHDYPRALALCDQLGDLLPAGERQYMSGRLHFLIALVHTWDTEESLERWDLPLGPAPGDLRGVWHWSNAVTLCCAGIQKFPERASVTEEDKDHLRDAIKHLEKAIASEHSLPASTRFMLARSYASIGDGYNSAKHYKWMLDHQNLFRQSCVDELGPLPGTEWFSKTLVPGIHACLVNAYDDAGEIDKAVSAAEAWITACPDHLGTCERMARLQQKRGDYGAAAEWLRREADRNPALGEDPNVSIILALGGIISLSRLDEALKSIAATHAQEHALVESVVKNYWPAFLQLDNDSRQRWVTGTWLLGTNAPQGAGTSVHCFAGIVERELRTAIFEPFAEYVRSRSDVLAQCTDDEATREFCRYLKGRGLFTLGQMFKVFGFTRRPALRIIASFAEWLKRDRPWLISGLDRLRTDKIVDFRNREDHADIRTIKTDEAEEMSRICREVINLLHPR